jgi:hypothetical protein
MSTATAGRVPLVASPAHWSWPARVAVIVGALLAALLVFDGSRWVDTHLGDTGVLVQGTHDALSCLSHGTFTNCAHVAGSRTSGVGAFAIAQYLVAAPMVALGLADATVQRGLAWVSAAAVAGMVVLAFTAGRHVLGRTWAVVFLLAIVSGPMLLYGLIPFGEALAAFLGMAMVLAACRRRAGWVLVTTLTACLTKETAAIFLVPLALVCARDDEEDGWLPPWRLTVATLVGAALAVVVNGAFNLFRFGSVSNLTYNGPYMRVPGVGLRVKLAVADWLAPNVGVLVFWTVPALILAGVLVFGVARLVRQPRVVRAWLPPLVVAAVTALWTGALASWWSTFGWIAWGPRLTLPLIPALVVAAVRTTRPGFDAGLSWLLGATWRAVGVAVVLIVLAVGQVGVVWNQAAVALPTVPDATCPVLKPVQDATPSYFYGCGLNAAWRLRPLSLWEASKGGPATQRLAEVLQAVTIGALVTWLVVDVRRRDSVRRPTHSGQLGGGLA